MIVGDIMIRIESMNKDEIYEFLDSLKDFSEENILEFFETNNLANNHEKTEEKIYLTKPEEEFKSIAKNILKIKHIGMMYLKLCQKLHLFLLQRIQKVLIILVMVLEKNLLFQIMKLIK